MPELHLRIILETDIVLSASMASVGGHRSLDRIRGGQLLGACAASGYLQEDRRFDLFHSGRVRYGDALPEAGDGVALPLPFCLHRAKASGRSSPGAAGAAVTLPARSGESVALTNLCIERPTGFQWEQQRKGFVAVDGTWLEVERGFSMRTAVDPDGRAKAGFLFGMESLAAGQVFRATVAADEEELLDAVRRHLLGAKRLGRSRSAEFGRVRIEDATPATAWPLEQKVPASESGGGGLLLVWCISDLALRDEATGAPRLLPVAHDLGLEGAAFDPDHSFLRFGRWSAFNAQHGRPGLERQVILAGSVLAFSLTPDALNGLDLAALRARLQAGIGEYRQEGLGRVLLQPSMLMPKTLTLHRGAPQDTSSHGASYGSATLPDDDLGRWLADRLSKDEAERKAWNLSRAWADTMSRYPAVGGSQWGELRRRAALQRYAGASKAALLEALREHLGTKANPKVDGKEVDAKANLSRQRRLGRGATARIWSKGSYQGRTAAQQLIDLVEAGGEGLSEKGLPLALDLLGMRMARIIKQKGGRDD